MRLFKSLLVYFSVHFDRSFQLLFQKIQRNQRAASSNELFASSLKSTLPQWRFYPAEAGGHKVKQIVQLPLKFVAPNH